MVEHVGKKRRKEIRQAAEYKKEANKHTLRCALLFVCLLVLLLIPIALQLLGLVDPTNMLLSAAQLIIVFVGCILVGSESKKASDARKTYKDYALKFEVTAEDVKAYIAGE